MSSHSEDGARERGRNQECSRQREIESAEDADGETDREDKEAREVRRETGLFTPTTFAHTLNSFLKATSTLRAYKYNTQKRDYSHQTTCEALFRLTFYFLRKKEKEIHVLSSPGFFVQKKHSYCIRHRFFVFFSSNHRDVDHRDVDHRRGSRGHSGSDFGRFSGSDVLSHLLYLHRLFQAF